jgi:methionine synthase II (cobalamin-independent)
MFSTLLGPLPPTTDADRDPEHEIRDNVADLAATGLELLSSGLPAVGPEADPATVVASWQRAAEATVHPVKQAILGPFSATGNGSAAETRRNAELVSRLVNALADAGCGFIEIEEPDVLAIAVVASERHRFHDAHRGLSEAVPATHCSLAITGGNVDAAGGETFFDLQYASFAFDLIAGPDNWRLIAAAPAERGIVCAALDPALGGDETRELLVWAAHYAASTRGRGLDRIGLANAPSLVGLPRAAALRKLARVAEAARIAAVESTTEMASLLDARAFGGRRERPGVVRLSGVDE